MHFAPTRTAKSGALAAALAALALCPLGGPAGAAGFGGELGGWVRDAKGVPQMGAAVSVLTSEGRLLRRVFTDHAGAFVLENLLPGNYSVKVKLDRFLPVDLRNLRVGLGSRKVLDVRLAGLFSGLQLGNPQASEIRDMSDDWKWALRASHAVRPALRLAPSKRDRETKRVMRKLSGAFHDTEAYAELSSGSGGRSDSLANHSDLGTAFAVATSLFGNNDVTVSGNMGYGSAVRSPSTGFRTSYRRDLGFGAPEVSLTVRQLQTSFGSRAFVDPQQARDAVPLLETMTLGFGDTAKIGDRTTFDYGFLYESVRWLNRLNFVSPYAKIIHELSPGRSVQVSFASGVPRPDSAVQGGDRLRQQVSALGTFPRVSLRNGQAQVQRTEHIEIAYREQVGKGLLEAGVYQDAISNAAVSALTPDGFIGAGEVLPDLFSRASTINGGEHMARGVRVSYARKIRERLEAALGYGAGGVLTAGEGDLAGGAGDLRHMLKMQRAHLITASLSMEEQRSGARFISTYQWSSRDSALSPDLYNDFAARSDPGFNVYIRQPIPVGGGLPGKLEASAEFRNLLKAGYMPINTSDGGAIYILPAVRSYRGALSFIF